ncbi:uncharacterized protein LOC143914104 [Arctopsyche grandis]|uniref:uncharacterized protein LOC143914104 n=1 Tax=Arctopsyche grandis TaxID=121162 RepID=UPI00406D8A58
MAVSANQSYIIVVGGIDDDTAGMIEEYDPYLNKWKTIYNLNKGIKYFSTALIDQKLYIFGGRFNNITTNKAWCFDLFTKKLVELPSMQKAKYFTTASVVNNSIYIIGGIDSDDKVLDTIEQWDTKGKYWKFLEPMSIERHSHASVVKDGDIFVIGGNDGTNVIQEVEFYSTTTKTWNAVNSMNWNRMNLAAVAVENYVYVIGGSDDSQGLDSVERFNSQNNIWEKITNLPFPVKGHSAVVNKSRIICFGDDRSERIFEYIPSVKAWTEIGKMANKRRFYSAFFTNFKLEPENQMTDDKEKTVDQPKLNIDKKLNTGKFSELINLFETNVIANKNKTMSENSKTESHKTSDPRSLTTLTLVKTTKSDNLLNDYSPIQRELLDINTEKIAVVGGYLVEMGNTVDIYDGENKSWALTKYIGNDKSKFASVVVGDRIVIMGGYNSSNQTLTSVEYIDLKNGQRHPLKPLNQARDSFSAVTLRRNSSTDIYAIGGFEIVNVKKYIRRILPSVERWSSRTENWEMIAPLLLPIDGHSASVTDDIIYVTGGRLYENGKNVSLNKVQIYSVETNSWTYGTQMNQARHAHSSVVFKGKLFIAGGFIEQANTCLDSIEYYDPIANLWTVFTKLPQPATGIGLCCFQNKLFCMGGFNGKIDLSDVWEYDERTKSWKYSKRFEVPGGEGAEDEALRAGGKGGA